MCMPIGYFIDTMGEHPFKALGLEINDAFQSTWGLFGILMLSTIVAVATIFLYKNRMLQIRMTIFNSLLLVGYYIAALAFYFALKNYANMFRVGWALCLLSTAAADFVEAQPESGVYYATTKNKRNENGERVKVEGFCVLPENWADSVYWTMDALSNLYAYGTLTDDEKAQVETMLADLQAECYEVYNQLKADPDNATAISAAAAQKVHEACVALVNAVK